MKKFLILFMIFTVNGYAETKVIDCTKNTMVEFGISKEYINKIKQEQGEDALYVIADDQNNYSFQAQNYAEENNIEMEFINFDEIDTVIFKAGKKEYKVPVKDNDWTMWFCSKNKKPEKSAIIDTIDKAKEYFK